MQHLLWIIMPFFIVQSQDDASVHTVYLYFLDVICSQIYYCNTMVFLEFQGIIFHDRGRLEGVMDNFL